MPMPMPTRLLTGDGRGDAGEMTTGSILPVRRGSREPVDKGFGRTARPGQPSRARRRPRSSSTPPETCSGRRRAPARESTRFIRPTNHT